MEEYVLAKKAVALLFLVEPRAGESLRDYVKRAERELEAMLVRERIPE